MSVPDSPKAPTNGLRERHAVPASRENNTSGSGDGLPQAQRDNEVPKEKKLMGTAPDGTVFVVPQTHDMVSQLLDPRQPKNASDIIILAILGLHILTLYLLPGFLRTPIFAVIFLFWRACYNGGIGYLLHVQSRHRRLIAWAKRLNLFVHPDTGKNPRPWLYNLIKREMETKIPQDYKFDDAPIEYNTWLVFRRVVDLVLMCDFTSYCLFVFTCASRPETESILTALVRWAIGILLVLLNVWVKLDAHRVVKDYAWYWGDFFYLIDQQLIFDGVFEMFPHPMYTMGYIGYYGIAGMAGSWYVLFISITAHISQIVFLLYIENPHIEKTYNSPAPRRRPEPLSPGDTLTADPAERKEGIEFHEQQEPSSQGSQKPVAVHDLIGIGNVDLFRITDVSVLLLQAYMIMLTAVTPSTPLWQTLFVLNAIAWRLWYSIGLGFLLERQSSTKMWIRHFLKFGESAEEAWRQWKGMYHMSMIMCHASFIAAAWKMYSVPEDWTRDMVLLKHVIGFGLLGAQVLTAASIYESLGEFGWFFGDFFFDQSPTLTYSGIHRYFNHPERFLGLVGFWGAALISWSRTIAFLALLSHVLTLGFLDFVEKPHMQKLYGRHLRPEAGLSKNIRRSLPAPLNKWQGSVDKVLNETSHFVEEFLEAARPRLAAGVSTFRRTTTLFSQYPALVTITRVSSDSDAYDPRDYSIQIEGTATSTSTVRERSTGKEGHTARLPQQRTDHYEPLSFEYGAPIKVKWTAPLHHSKSDWIGLYMVADNASRDVTRVSSAGRWVATVPNEYEATPADKGILIADQLVSATENENGPAHDHVMGEMIFEGDKLWWTQGVFEFRYHHDGKHNVMAISLPFETRIGRFDEDDVDLDSNGLVLSAVEAALLPVVRNCFDRDPDIAPTTVDESFGSLAERDSKYAKRVVFALHQMFGIEFAAGVVVADGNVKKLAWRIYNAKQVLAPYSMSHSKGTSTPAGEKA